MTAVRVDFLPSAARDYKRLDAPIQSRILTSIRRLGHGTHAGKPLQGPYRGLFSYRVGEYRIVYRPESAPRRILIHRIGHRRDVYR